MKRESDGARVEASDLGDGTKCFEGEIPHAGRVLQIVGGEFDTGD